MLRLTLVRHATASWDGSQARDFERPLDAGGRREAPVMALRARNLRRAPDLLVSSPAVRAISTARLFAERFGVPEADIVEEPRIYDASLPTLVDVLRSLPADASHVMVFGHNPGLSELSRWLATCPFDDMPTCAVATFDLAVDAWPEVDAGCGRLVRYLHPRDGQS